MSAHVKPALVLLLLLLPLFHAMSPAAGRSISHEESQSTPAATQSTPAANGAWKLSKPIQHENLVIYPITTSRSTRSTNLVRTGSYITLDDGLKKGLVLVSEIGATGRAHRLRRGQAASNDAQVNRLLVTNKSGKTLLLIAGELIVGGNQDRIIGHDCMVAARSRHTPVDVFCVEHGRWSENPAFGETREDTVIARDTSSYRNERRRHPREVVQGDAAGGQFFVAAKEAMAAPAVREKAQVEEDQMTVWASVSALEVQLNAESSTGSLNRVFEDSKVKARLNAYESAFTGRLPQGSVGVVAAINGEIISGDAFANEALFRHYWPKLLRSLALQASGAVEQKSVVPSIDAARAFLSAKSESMPTEARRRQYRLVERKSETDASFELRSPSTSVSEVIHMNKVAKH